MKYKYIVIMSILIIRMSFVEAQAVWSTYDTRDVMRSDVVTSIAIDQNNVKWFGHGYSGVTRYNDKGFKIVSFSDYGATIAVDKNNVKWFAGFGSVLSYDDAGDEVIKKEHPYFFERDGYGGYVTAIAVDENNYKWISAYSSAPNLSPMMFRYDGENITQYGLHDEIATIFIEKNNNIWAAGGGLHYYLDSNWHLETTGNEIIENGCFYRITIEKSDTLWGGIWEKEHSVYTNGLCLSAYDGLEWRIYTTENSPLPSNNIYSIIVDHNNTKWIGTDAGVCRFDGETWTTFNTDNSGLCDNKVNAIAVEDNNIIWFGTNNGVSRYTGEIISTSVDEKEQTPESLPLITTYPNPFNPSTTIEFILPESGFATISIYSMAGQKIRELNADYLTAGTHTLSWDGRDAHGNAVSSGIYITRLQAGKHTATGRMVLLK